MLAENGVLIVDNGDIATVNEIPQKCGERTPPIDQFVFGKVFRDILFVAVRVRTSWYRQRVNPKVLFYFLHSLLNLLHDHSFTHGYFSRKKSTSIPCCFPAQASSNLTINVREIQTRSGIMGSLGTIVTTTILMVDRECCSFEYCPLPIIPGFSVLNYLGRKVLSEAHIA